MQAELLKYQITIPTAIHDGFTHRVWSLQYESMLFVYVVIHANLRLKDTEIAGDNMWFATQSWPSKPIIIV